jgi:hypothetical protein
MTATEMIPYVGQTVMVRCESLTIECRITNVKCAWGKTRVEIEPTAGNGRQWVELARVS